mmetsp:Transcript_94840/g.306183  ORF Transcript_94840/g.306183 Transcript_94840/m.306183 type:complete len:344 (+) Transcript_94840:1725-2756(+)
MDGHHVPRSVLLAEALHVLADDAQLRERAGVVVREPALVELLLEASLGVGPLRAEVVYLVVPGVEGREEGLHLVHGIPELLLQPVLGRKAHGYDLPGDVREVQVQAPARIDETPLFLGHEMLGEGLEGGKRQVEAQHVQKEYGPAQHHQYGASYGGILAAHTGRGEHQHEVRDDQNGEDHNVGFRGFLLPEQPQPNVHQVAEDRHLGEVPVVGVATSVLHVAKHERVVGGVHQQGHDAEQQHHDLADGPQDPSAQLRLLQAKPCVLSRGGSHDQRQGATATCGAPCRLPAALTKFQVGETLAAGQGRRGGLPVFRGGKAAGPARGGHRDSADRCVDARGQRPW